MGNILGPFVSRPGAPSAAHVWSCLPALPAPAHLPHPSPAQPCRPCPSSSPQAHLPPVPWAKPGCPWNPRWSRSSADRTQSPSPSSAQPTSLRVTPHHLPLSTSASRSPTAHPRHAPSPSTSPAWAVMARRAALTASSSMCPGEAWGGRVPGTLPSPPQGPLPLTAFLRFAATGMSSFPAWVVSKTRSPCVPPMIRTRRRGRAWRRRRRRPEVAAPLSSSRGAATWVSWGLGESGYGVGNLGAASW